MRSPTAALLGAALLASAACSGRPAPLTEADRTAARTMDSAFAVAVNAGDVNGMVAHLAPDAMMLPPGMPVATGVEAIRELFTGMMQAGPVRLAITTGTVEGSGDIMYVTGSYELQPVAADTAQPMPPVEHGKFLEVFRRQEDGSWKLVRDMWSANTMPIPPAPAPAAGRRN